jgi:hypothetical protein
MAESEDCDRCLGKGYYLGSYGIHISCPCQLKEKARLMNSEIEVKREGSSKIAIDNNKMLTILSLLQTDFMFREIFGKGIIPAFKEIYGEKFSKEGYFFDSEIDEILKCFYEEYVQKYKKSEVKENGNKDSEKRNT